MDEDSFMVSMLEQMTDDELEAFCDILKTISDEKEDED